MRRTPRLPTTRASPPPRSRATSRLGSTSAGGGLWRHSGRVTCAPARISGSGSSSSIWIGVIASLADVLDGPSDIGRTARRRPHGQARFRRERPTLARLRDRPGQRDLPLLRPGPKRVRDRGRLQGHVRCRLHRPRRRPWTPSCRSSGALLAAGQTGSVREVVQANRSSMEFWRQVGELPSLDDLGEADLTSFRRGVRPGCGGA